MISVIVPVYNKKPYLEKCIRSVQEQTYQDWELILSDDGSTDGSRELCEHFAATNHNILLIKNEHSGVSGARNAGIEASNGDFVTFLDADDWWEKEFLSQAMLAMYDEKVDIFAAGYKSIYQGQCNKTMTIKADITGKSMEFSQAQMTDLLKNAYIASSCGKVYRKSMIRNHYFNTDLVWGEDLVFVHDLLAENVMISAVPDAYYCYQYVPNSLISNTTLQKARSVVTTYHTLFQSVQKRNWVSGEYYDYTRKRCTEDVNIIQRMILNQSMTLTMKRKVLSVILHDEQIVSAMRSTIGKTRLGKLSFSPYIILLKHQLGR